ncbi:MAG: molybdate ABC transporter permease subunit [Dehalococcoidia bacterium]|nr:molybdate ABC transporter permease subunit [Dehalococcoidia bacterium]
MSLGIIEINIILLSLKIAFFSTLITTIFGFLIAFYLEKSQSWISFLVDVLVSLPLLMPPVIIGYALLWIFSPLSPIGTVIENLFGNSIVFTWVAASLAAAIVSLPLVVNMFRVSLLNIGPELENSAKTLGLSNIQIFLFIIIPVAKKGLIAGIMLGFFRSLAEFGATIIVAGNIPGISQTLPLAIFTRISSGDDSGALNLIIISVTLGVISITINKLILSKKV